MLWFFFQTNKKKENWWVGARKRKKRAFSVPFILSARNFLNICVLSQCIVYGVHFQNIHTFTHQKTLLIHFCCLFLKLLKAFSVSVSIGGSMHIGQSNRNNHRKYLLVTSVEKILETSATKFNFYERCGLQICSLSK